MIILSHKELFMIYEHYKVKKKNLLEKTSTATIIKLAILISLVLILASILITRDVVNYKQSINQTILKGYLNSLELKTAYGYNHPEQKVDITLTEYAWNYLVTNNQLCNQKTQLTLKEEDKNASFIDCQEIIRISQDPQGKHVSVFIPQQNNNDQYSNVQTLVSEYRFFIDFRDGDPSLLNFKWNLIDRKGKFRSLEFCQNRPNLCKYIYIAKGKK